VTVTAAASLGSPACGDDPFAIRWTENPDTVTLYSLARPERNLLSAFSFLTRTAIRIESATATGTWDMAVDTRGGEIVLLPPGALGVTSRARIAPLPGTTFAEVIEAPADTLLYTADQPVPVTMGTIYVVRTNQYQGSFGTRCTNYAKLEPLVIDPSGGTLSFVFDASPVCNDRRLIPPD
jgi:hypothetical protein